jgi:hypothetical protein
VVGGDLVKKYFYNPISILSNSLPSQYNRMVDNFRICIGGGFFRVCESGTSWLNHRGYNPAVGYLIRR